MAPKSFKNFGKLPLELRLKIWNYSSTPRIVRAKWDNYSDKKYVAVIHLSNGPMPNLLRICSESRHEALRHFTLVATDLTLRPEADLAFTDKKVRKIWVDLERDTFYFVNFPSTLQLMYWWNKMHNPQIGGAGGLKLEMQIKDKFDEEAMRKRINARDFNEAEAKAKAVYLKSIAASRSVIIKRRVTIPDENQKYGYRKQVQQASLAPKAKLDEATFKQPNLLIKVPFEQLIPSPTVLLSAKRRVIKNIAFSARVMIRIGECIKRRDVFYSLLMEIPSLKDIKIVLINSDQFERTQDQHRFYFKPTKPLKEGAKGNVGGTWGNKKIRDKLQEFYNAPEFWTKPKDILSPALLGFNKQNQLKVVKQWEYWLAHHPEWKGPNFVMVSIGKSNLAQL